MFSNFWFWGPLVLFLLLSGLRIYIAIREFKIDKFMPKDSFNIVSGAIPTISVLTSLIAAAMAILGGNGVLKIPLSVMAVVSSVGLMMGLTAIIGFYLKAMIPRYRHNSTEMYQFPSPYYPSLKAVYVTAGFVQILTLFAFFIVLLFSVSGGYNKIKPTDSKTATESEMMQPTKEKE